MIVNVIVNVNTSISVNAYILMRSMKMNCKYYFLINLVYISWA